MRFPTRLFVCASAAVFCILYISWLRPSSPIRDNIQSVWKGTAHRLVVFGDDWSDTGKYRVSPPPKSTVTTRDPDRGDLWTEVVCKELKCDFIDNFARSVPSALDLAAVGSLIDSDIYANATADKRKETLAVFDFQTQVQQFIEYEEEKNWVSGRLRKIDEWTVFTVFFGLWDLLNYAELEKEAALHAIDRSIEELFHNLDILADHVGAPITVVIPRLVDVTFLPCFQARKNTTQGEFAPQQHQSVVMWTYWNTALSQTAAKWKKGSIHMPDLNHLLVDQIRATQLHSEGISDASGNGKQTPLFDEVKRPCLLLKTDNSTGELQPAGVEKCFDPARHLFWDSVHLSGPAHQLIGKEAARLVRGNETVNVDDRERAKQGSTAHQNDKQTTDDGFNLKMAPGY